MYVGTNPLDRKDEHDDPGLGRNASRPVAIVPPRSSNSTLAPPGTESRSGLQKAPNVMASEAR